MAEEKASKEEQIGFHKGALTTLAKEREEMVKIVGIVEQLIQMHIKALKELGVDIEAQAKEMQSQAESAPKEDKEKKPIEDLI